MPFMGQQIVNTQPAPAVEGDFCSHNPRYSALTGPGGFVAGAQGAVAARFAWASYATIDTDNAPATINTFGSGPVDGFIHREQQGLIIQYLAGSSMMVQPGFPVTVLTSCEVWVTNRGATTATRNQKCYAKLSDGSAAFGPTGTPPAGATSTASSVAASTFSVTGGIVNNVMTVTAVGAGTIVNGATISGTGVVTGTQVTGQLSGTPGGVGTYSVNIPNQAVAAGTTISGTYGTLTVGGTVTGSYGPGGVISGSGVVAGTRITQQLSGTTGGAGTYAVDNNTVVASTAIASTTYVETSWFCRSQGAVGELVKISNLPPPG